MALNCVTVTTVTGVTVSEYICSNMVQFHEIWIKIRFKSDKLD